VYLLGGLRQVTNDNAGIESFLLDVAFAYAGDTTRVSRGVVDEF